MTMFFKALNIYPNFFVSHNEGQTALKGLRPSGGSKHVNVLVYHDKFLIELG